MRAYAELEKQLSGEGRVREVYEKIEKPLIPVLHEAQEHGVLVDLPVVERFVKKISSRTGTVGKENL